MSKLTSIRSKANSKIGNMWSENRAAEKFKKRMQINSELVALNAEREAIQTEQKNIATATKAVTIEVLVIFIFISVTNSVGAKLAKL